MLASSDHALLPAAIVPVLLMLVALLGFSYQQVKMMKFSKATLDKLITFHAFAIEAIQLLIAFVGVSNCIIFSTAILELGEEFGLMNAVELLVTFALHIFAVYAVDFIEGLVLLGQWKHPYDDQCLVLTKNLLLSRWNNHYRRTSKDLKTVKAVDAVTAQTLKSLARLDYLDLAYDTQGCARSLRSHAFLRSSSARVPPTSILVNSGRSEKPAMPRSSTKKRVHVAYALERIAVSPGGTARRHSML